MSYWYPLIGVEPGDPKGIRRMRSMNACPRAKAMSRCFRSCERRELPSSTRPRAVVATARIEKVTTTSTRENPACTFLRFTV